MKKNKSTNQLSSDEFQTRTKIIRNLTDKVEFEFQIWGRILENLVKFHHNLAPKCQKLKVLCQKYITEVINWSKVTHFDLKRP